MILAKRVRRNKPDRVLTEDGWVDVTTINDEPSEGVVLDTTAFGDPPVCDDCGFEAKSTGGLSTHQRTHKGED